MSELKPIPEATMYEIMIVETKNALTKSLIMEKLLQKAAFRDKMKSDPDPGRMKLNDQALAVEQAKVKGYIATIKDLEVMHTEYLEKNKDTGNT